MNEIILETVGLNLKINNILKQILKINWIKFWLEVFIV